MKKILKKIRFRKVHIVYAVLALVLVATVGFFANTFFSNLGTIQTSGWSWSFCRLGTLFQAMTWVYGLLLCGMVALFIVLFNGENATKKAKRIMSGQADAVNGALENSRFLTDEERDRYFPRFDFSQAAAAKKDGVPMCAVLDKRGRLQVNIYSGAHSLVIGATGSGKTTTFINPMIQIIGASAPKSSMIMTDPKGELFSLHSKFLQSQGYKVLLLDLRDTYNSSRWNPLESIWDMYQDYLRAGQGIKLHRDSPDAPQYAALKRADPGMTPGDYWLEYSGAAYFDREHCVDDVTVRKQKIFDEMYEDLNDLVSVLCPVESKDDPVWEKGAKSIIMATLLAMLEDSEDPALGMTKEKYNFFNLNKAIANSENEFRALKEYFQGRSSLSTAVTLSRQVLSAADSTLSSYMSIAFDKMNLFNDRGICGLTSATDIDPADFVVHPTALFMKIPDEKDTRHGLAAVFILCMYKALIKIASTREDLSLPRNVYFILDEFGNMPKIEKFDKMITVGRSRKIWFNMVVQSYSQLNNVYGEQVADIIKSNCAAKMFIGSNDIGTCKEFSELCGNTTVATSSVSGGTGDKKGDLSISTQMQTRPLIYPSELQKLNNKESTGNAIFVTFGNYPLKTKFTPSYKCPLYQIGQMDISDIRANAFHADRVFYPLDRRNERVLGKS